MKVNKVFENVFFPFFFEWDQKELVARIVEHRLKLVHNHQMKRDDET